MSNEQVSEAGRALAELGASKGGLARAAKLSPEERIASARRAAEARWSGDIPKATHGSPDHPLRIGDIEIPCYVLEDGRRVLAQTGMVGALGMSHGGTGGKGGDRLAKFVQGNRLKDFVSKDLRDRTEDPIKFRTTSGNLAYGYEATVLADLCDAVLAARLRGELQKQQMHIAEQCEILVRGFARVGIIALVDEATGYQEYRAREALAEILEKFISVELRRWIKTFPDEYFRELARVKGIRLSTVSVKRPQYMGHLTNDIVYKRLAPGVLQELQRITPRTDSGRRRHTFHQRLTDDIGHPKLREHLIAVISLMRACNDGDWSSFKRLLDRSLPKYKEMPLFPNLND